MAVQLVDMNQEEFIVQNLGIDATSFGKIQTFIDYGNVDRWFDKDTAPFLGKIIENSATL